MVRAELSKEDEKRNEFRSILMELSDSEEILKDKAMQSEFYIRLEQLYHDPCGNDFRHFYSDIFMVLSLIKKEKGTQYLDCIGQNIAVLRKGYQIKNVDENGVDIDISDSIKKLYDHVSLDIARLEYSEGIDQEITGQEEIQAVRAQISSTNAEFDRRIDEQQSRIDSQQKKIEGQQREYIAILGIFSAIIITFIGGLSFSTSVLESLDKADVFKMLFAALVIGFVLLNLIFGLFFYVDRIVLGRKGDHRPIMISNIFCGILVVIVIVAWGINSHPEVLEQFVKSNSVAIQTEVVTE